jgi:hypothetical protein
MLRWIKCLLLIAPVIACFPLTSGCGKKTTTVQQEERIEESEPEMVSPGEEVIE